MSMEFAWDEDKRQINLEKHGVDFADAVLVLAEAPLILEDMRRDYGEQQGDTMNRSSPKTSPIHMTLREAKAAASQTDWQRLNNLTDEEITRAAEADTDNLPLDDPFFEAARRLPPAALLKEAKQQITLRIDADVLEWFRTSGSGYQSRINAVLKAYVQTHGGHSSQI